MIEGFGVALVGAVVVVGVIFEMLRRRYVRGRFAIVWLVVAGATIILAVAPGLLEWAAGIVGVRVPLNLLFFVGFLGLMLIIIQLTAAIGRLEQRTRALAEQVALMDAQRKELSPNSLDGDGPAK
ncbi:DUF2304 domain-containing protein [Terrabacter sp. Root181]|uniref:DUF2304 domain-containing protein n=1 Tax=Terrabacter sp. Root181 TaxID=1736484 RepID=UPI0006F60D91|nr:DUF2304 domain-containing protein [Terrabacter sp. Root181]KRB43874.1 hypothetical protein ASD90_19865 [Terrabacter sp. Root181]